MKNMGRRLQCFGPKFQLQFGVLERCYYSLLDRPVDPFRLSILHGCVCNGLLVSDPFLRQVLFEGSGGVFSSVVGLECLYSFSYPFFHFG